MQIQIAPAPRPVASRRHSALVASGLSALFLAACGGGGSSPAASPAPSVTVSTSVATADTGATTTAAVVNIATGTSSVNLTASSNGTYALTIPTSQLPATNSGTSVVVTISKDGYVPTSVVIPPDQLVSGSNITIPKVTLAVATTADLIPVAGTFLTRLGNGVAGGAENSQLQTTLTAAMSTKFIQLGPIDSRLAVQDGSISTGYPTMTLSMSFRGLQPSTCADSISVFQSQSASTSTAPTATDGTATTVISSTSTPEALTDSDTTGGMTPAQFTIPTTGFNKNNGALWVQISSGACHSSAGTDALDDFEFVDVRARFNAR